MIYNEREQRRSANADVFLRFQYLGKKGNLHRTDWEEQV